MRNEGKKEKKVCQCVHEVVNFQVSVQMFLVVWGTMDIGMQKILSEGMNFKLLMCALIPI